MTNRFDSSRGGLRGINDPGESIRVWGEIHPVLGNYRREQFGKILEAL